MRLVHGDRSRDARARPLRDGAEVVIDGRSQRVAVRRVSASGFELQRESGRELFHCVRDGETLHLHWRGRPYELRIERDGAPRANRHVASTLEAPMPGKVIEVSVAVGQQVEKGERILVVEAMKMENQLRAPKAGRVASVAVKVGDKVVPGLVLAEIE